MTTQHTAGAIAPYSQGERAAIVLCSSAATLIALLAALGIYGVFHHNPHSLLTSSGFILALSMWMLWFGGESTFSRNRTSAAQAAPASGHRSAPEPQIGSREQTMLLDQALDAIILRDLRERLLYRNPAAERLFGWTDAEAAAMRMEQFYPASEQDRLGGAIEAFHTNGSWEGEFQNVTKSGTTITVHTRWSLVRDGAGAPAAWLMVLRDVTEQRALEARLRRAQRLESLGTLAGGIAHDLNNILTPIFLATEVLEANVSDPAAKPVVATLRATAKRGKNIVKQVLTFARGAEEQYGLQQMHTLTGDMVAMLREILPKQIQVAADLKPVADVYGDATQIEQVIMNLCVNARDAMPRGGTLEISLSNVAVDEAHIRQEPRVPCGEYVLLTVSDNGSGIAPEHQEKIFQPFFTTKAAGHGTGLGLSTVLAIVKAHKGIITLRSEQGKGTRFDIYFPAASRTDEVVSTDELPALVSGSGETILLVDDEQAVLQLGKEILESSGYTVITAASGDEAVRIVRTVSHEHDGENGQVGQIGLIVCDMNMPGMDGAQTVREIRALRPEAGILISSGSISDGDRDSLQHLDVQGFLPKPFTAAQFLTAVYAAAKGRASAGGSQPG